MEWRKGYCAHCPDVECRDVLGEDLFPDSPTLLDRVFWQCPLCKAFVHSDKDGKPLGTAANDELRNARARTKERFESLYANAHKHPAYDGLAENAPNNQERIKALAIVKNTARARTRKYLMDRLNLTQEQFSVFLWDLDTCRRAWFAMRGVDYDTVRKWAKREQRKSGHAEQLSEVSSGHTEGGRGEGEQQKRSGGEDE